MKKKDTILRIKTKDGCIFDVCLTDVVNLMEGDSITGVEFGNLKGDRNENGLA